MPIMNSKPSAPQPTKPSPNEAIPAPYKGVTVDSRYTPLSSLITHVEGSSWVVKYFSQVLDIDSEVSPQQLTKEAVYQQYTAINQLEMRVNNELSYSQDDASKAATVTGSATLYPCVIPNTGDMFLADIGDGREGIFTVTRTERKSLLKETCYQIEYVLVAYSTDTERMRDLEQKTIKTLQFVKEFLLFGQNPVVVDSEYATVRELKTSYRNF